jgi:pyruvate dehydrogenase E1 component
MDTLLYYKEAKNGQILEEGITESGSMCSFIAAGTAYANHGINTIPFFIYYSMFGFQRIGDLIWAAADMRCRGFLVGGTAGRTTLAGEGLQHQDGHSHVLALPVPNLLAYDPAFAYEIAIIFRMASSGCISIRSRSSLPDRRQRATVDAEMPRGKCPRRRAERLVPLQTTAKSDARAQLLGSGAIMFEVLKAQEILEKIWRGMDVWSVTSYKQLYRDANDCERWNMLQTQRRPRRCPTLPKH